MDNALKQRLVGASVLVALAVVVLPMLLGGETRSPQEARTIELPIKPRETAFETRRFPIGTQEPQQPSVLTPPAPAPAELQLRPPVTATSPEPAPGEVTAAQAGTPAAPESAAAPLPAPTAPVADSVGDSGEAILADKPRIAERSSLSSSSDGRYLVQVASFSSTGNANRLAGQLGEASMPVLMDTVDSAAGVLHRVRVGPFSDRQQADQVIADLNRMIPDLRPRVLDLRPDDESPVATPADPLVRWVVQVGSFAEAQNAEGLVFRLRDAGFRASSRAVSSGGTTAHKVQVGPVLERSEAIRLAASIEDQMGLDGLVMSAD